MSTHAHDETTIGETWLSPERVDWLRDRYETLAGDLGRLRRASVDTPFEHRVNHLCDQTWVLLAQITPTAADLVKDGMRVDAALATADRETRRMNRLLGL